MTPAGADAAEVPASARDMEKLEEEKLKAKYPAAAAAQGLRGAPGGHSVFLQKRLQKGVRTRLYATELHNPV